MSWGLWTSEHSAGWLESCLPMSVVWAHDVLQVELRNCAKVLVEACDVWMRTDVENGAGEAPGGLPKVDIRGYLQSSQSLTHSPRLDQWFALRFDSEEEVFLPAVLCSSDHGLQSGKSQLRSVEMSRRDQFYFSEGRTPRLCAPRCMPTPSRSVLPLGVSCRRER